jgi:hypothetical protein
MVVTTKTALAGTVAAVMLVSLGVAVPSSSALGTSAFCQTIFTYKPIKPPSTFTTTTYHAWAKSYLPFYEELASEAAKSSTKKVLTEIVTVLKYEANAKSLTSLEKYVATNQTTWTNDAKALANAIIACAK